MTPKQLAFKAAAETTIKNLNKRRMDGFFFEDSASCVQAILKLMADGSSVSWGGSESIKECGLIDRTLAKSYEESRQLFARSVLADYYLMSTNAITLEGELINIDGNGNRIACLVQGPRYVIIVAGMNKLVSDVPSGYKRVKDIASPANTQRLSKNTPCFHTGKCGDCLSPDCICSHTVITRRSGIPGRIKIFFVAEELGY